MEHEFGESLDGKWGGLDGANGLREGGFLSLVGGLMRWVGEIKQG